MAIIRVGFNFIGWNGSDLTLAAAPWKNNVTAIYKENTSRSGLFSFTPASAFPAFTTLANRAIYLIVANTEFTLEDAVLMLPTVSAPSNVTPVANAGADNSITLPTNSITLQGSGVDSDGSISSYAWVQTIGPNTASISATNVASPTVSNLIVGMYEFRLTVTDNNGATHQDTVQITVNPSANSVINISRYTENTGTIAAGSGHSVPFSEFSYASIQHNGNQAKVTIWTNILDGVAPNNDGNVSPVGIGVMDNGVIVGLARPTALGLSTVTVNLPGSGLRTTDFINSFIQNYESQGVYYGACVVSVEIVGATSAIELNPSPKSNSVVWRGDSTIGGIQSTAPPLTSPIGKVRILMPTWGFAAAGAGGARIANRYNTAQLRQIRINEVMAAWGNSANPYLAFGPFGINDWFFMTGTGATLASYIGAFFDELKAAMQAAGKPVPKILLITPFMTTVENQSGKLESVPSFRNGLATAVNGRTSFVKLLDGAALTSQLYDSVHPNDNGYAEAAPKIQAALLAPWTEVTTVHGYVSGATPLTFTSAENELTQSENTIKAAGAPSTNIPATYGFTGKATHKVPFGATARIVMQRKTDNGNAGNAVLGITSSNTEVPLASMLAAVYLAPDDYFEGGTLVTPAGGMVYRTPANPYDLQRVLPIGGYFGLYIDGSTNQVSIQYSDNADGSNWQTIAANVTTVTGDSYIVTDLYGPSGVAYNVQATGVTLMSGSAAEWTSQYISGFTPLTFTSAQGELRQTNGVLKAYVSEMLPASYGFTGKATYKLPGNVSGRIIMQRKTEKGSAGNAILGITSSNAEVPFASMVAAIFMSPDDYYEGATLVAPSGNLQYTASGTVHNVNQVIPVNGLCAIYIDRGTGKASIQWTANADGTNWQTIAANVANVSGDVFIAMDLYGQNGLAYYVQATGVVSI